MTDNSGSSTPIPDLDKLKKQLGETVKRMVAEKIDPTDIIEAALKELGPIEKQQIYNALTAKQKGQGRGPGWGT